MNNAFGHLIRPVDSHTNFVFFKTTQKAVDLIEHFKNHRILIGPHYTGYDDHIRVSIGLPQEMEAFWCVWDLLPGGKRMPM